MADPEQPQDQPPPKPRKKKLPPLKGDGDDGEAQPAAARRPRKKAEATPAAEGEGGDVAEPPKPRRKKRQPARPSGEDSPEHAAGPVSAEQQLLPPGDPQEAERPKRKKKKPRRPAGEEENGEEARRSPEGQEQAAASQVGAGDTAGAAERTRHIDVEGMPLAKVLEAVRDDVVTKGQGQDNLGADLREDEKGEEAMVDDDAMKLAGQAGGDSNLSDTIFRQTHHTRAFKAEKIEKYQQRVDQERRERDMYQQGAVEEDTSNRTLKCAVGFTKVYNYIGTVLIGLIPGFAAFHSMYVWTLPSDHMSFLQGYASLGSPMPILFYVALTLILLSVLERYDSGKLDPASCLECVSFRHAGMVLVLFLPAYLVSNAMYPTDMWIRGYVSNSTGYSAMADGTSIVQTWRILDIVRSIALVLGWIVVAFNTGFNKLAINLQSELDDLIGEDNVELQGNKSAA